MVIRNHPAEEMQAAAWQVFRQNGYTGRTTNDTNPNQVNQMKGNKMKTPTLPILLGAAALAVAGCSSVTVQTDYDHSAKFGQYHTYTLAPATNGLTLSPTSETALSDSLRTNLAVRGITEVSGQAADLEVVRHVFTRKQTSVQQYSNWGYGVGARWPARYGSYGMWAGAPATYTDVSQYIEGTLVLDFVDVKTQKLVFRGTATGTVGSTKANAKSIEKAVTKIVHDFPKPTAP
jgi:hypothetical protein